MKQTHTTPPAGYASIVTKAGETILTTDTALNHYGKGLIDLKIDHVLRYTKEAKK